MGDDMVRSSGGKERAVCHRRNNGRKNHVRGGQNLMVYIEKMRKSRTEPCGKTEGRQ